jgi:hypothetical protein
LPDSKAFEKAELFPDISIGDAPQREGSTP